MFPQGLRNFTSGLFYGTISGIKSTYSFSRSASWIFFSTATILIAPVVFEAERAQLEEVQRQQQRQVKIILSLSMLVLVLAAQLFIIKFCFKRSMLYQYICLLIKNK